VEGVGVVVDVHKKKVQYFLNRIREVCRNLGFSLAHEDFHGAFIIEDYDEQNIKWLFSASDQTTPDESEEAQFLQSLRDRVEESLQDEEDDDPESLKSFWLHLNQLFEDTLNIIEELQFSMIYNPEWDNEPCPKWECEECGAKGDDRETLEHKEDCKIRYLIEKLRIVRGYRPEDCKEHVYGNRIQVPLKTKDFKEGVIHWEEKCKRCGHILKYTEKYTKQRET
jgi:hypothetical protein